MARFDIMPFTAHQGGHNMVLPFPVGDASTFNTANTSWREGEVLLLDAAAGDINVIADGIENVLIGHYIAAESSQFALESRGIASAAATPAATVSCYPIVGREAGAFITTNAVTSSDTLLTSAQMDAILIGDTVGLWRDNTATGVANDGENGTFAVNTAGTGLQLLRKLDADGRDVHMVGAAGTVFFVVGNNAV